MCQEACLVKFAHIPAEISRSNTGRYDIGLTVGVNSHKRVANGFDTWVLEMMHKCVIWH